MSESILNPNKYLTQANFLTRSLFKLDKEIHRDIIYLIQNKIDYYGEPKTNIQISFEDFLKAKQIKRNNSYSFEELHNFTSEISRIHGAFYNKISNNFISFNLIDNVQIDVENPETLIVELAKFGKVFFYKNELENYLKKTTPLIKKLKYSGHTQIDPGIFQIKGVKRKKFFELICQFQNTGYFKISVKQLKAYLGYLKINEKEANQTFSPASQLKLIFSPIDDNYLIDSCPNYSIFERSFLEKAIKAINKDPNNTIRNLRIVKKLKTGRFITHLEFAFESARAKFTQEEKNCLKMFTELGLDENQIKYLIRRIGHEEMIKRYMFRIEKKSFGGDREFRIIDKRTNNPISNLPGFLYKTVFPELLSKN